MSHDDEVCLKLGREIVRMIRDLKKSAGDELGYARRVFTYPGGEAHVILANHKTIADLMDQSAQAAHQIVDSVPHSQKN